MCLHWSGWLGLGLGLGMSSYIHLSVNAGVQSYFWFSQFSHRLNVKKLASAQVFRSWLLLLILTRTLNFREDTTLDLPLHPSDESLLRLPPGLFQTIEADQIT